MGGKVLVRIIAVIVLVALGIGVYIVASRNEKTAAQQAEESQESGDGGPSSLANVVLINEIMNSNGTAVADDNGEYSDYLELYNASEEPVNITGWGLSDSVKQIAKWTFPAHTMQPGEYLVVFASGAAEAQPFSDVFHTSFKLNGENDVLILTDSAANVVDQISLVPTQSNYTMERDSNSEWAESALFSPGFANGEAGHSAYLESIKTTDVALMITELMPSNRMTLPAGNGVYEDYAEIYNAGSTAINLNNYALSDDPQELMRWRFPDVEIQPGEHLLVYCNGAGVRDDTRLGENGDIYTSFGLSSAGESLILSTPDARIIDSVDFPALGVDIAYLRDGSTGEWTESDKPSPGYENTEQGQADYLDSLGLGAGPVAISELGFSGSGEPAADGVQYDWVELHNSSDQPVDLAGWFLSDSTKNPRKWTFPSATIPAGGYQIVYCSGNVDAETIAAESAPEDETSETPEEAADTKKNNLHTSFGISNAGEEFVLLSDPEGNLLDRVGTQSIPFDMSYGRLADQRGFFYFDEPTPGTANTGGRSGFAAAPTLSVTAGRYEGSQTVEIQCATPGASITYTLDCTEPKESSTAYSGPIQVDETTVLRVRSFADGLYQSDIVTANYLIGTPHSLPVITVVTEPDNLWSDDGGIYAYGPNAQDTFPFAGANFHQDWERPVHFSILEPDGSLSFEQDCGAKIFGAYSRAGNDGTQKGDVTPKALSLFARSEYGKNRFEHAFFEDRPFTSYKSLVLRQGGQDYYMAKVRDIVQTSLVRETTDLDVQAYRQCVLYLNGEYWGLYNIREKVNKSYLMQHHNIQDQNAIELLVGNGTPLGLDGETEEDIDEQRAADKVAYQNMLDFVRNNDLSSEENFEKLGTMLDIDNYTDYLIAEIWSANTDTGNIKYWRQKPDGRFRHIFYDLDWGMFEYGDDRNSIAMYFVDDGHGIGDNFTNAINKGLMQNAGYREKFLQRLGYHLQNTFSEERVLSFIDAALANIEDEIERDRSRWSLGPTEGWVRQTDRIRTFAKERNGYVRKHVQAYFGLSSSEMQEYFGTDSVAQ